MVSPWESIRKFVDYWQVYLIKDLHNLDVSVWDVEIVLEYIRTSWYDSPSFTDANPTCKLTALLPHSLQRGISNSILFYSHYFDKPSYFFRNVQPPTFSGFITGKNKACMKLKQKKFLKLC